MATVRKFPVTDANGNILYYEYAYSGDGSDNFIVGGRGNDTLIGAAGDDFLVGDSDPYFVPADGATGYSDFIDGDAGNDTLIGCAGNDTLRGGSGKDQLEVVNGHGLFLQDDWDSNDTIVSGSVFGGTVDYRLANNQAGAIVADLGAGSVKKYLAGKSMPTQDSLTYVNAIIGSDGGDTLKGNSSANTLSGAGGNDVIDGANGNDVLQGGDGADTLKGGADDDRINGGNGDDLILQAIIKNPTAGQTGTYIENDTIDGGAGIDTLDYRSSVSGTSVRLDLDGAEVEKYLAGKLVGTDRISNIELFIGTAGSDTLSGGLSNATLDGATGNDVLDYRGLENVSIQLDVASGTVVKLRDGVSIGNDSFRNVERFSGSGGDDVMTGSTGVDIFFGLSGDDTLIGGAWVDQLDGGDGNDLINGGSFIGTLSGGDGDDFILQDDYHGLATIDGGDGFDTLSYLQGPTGNGYVYVNLTAQAGIKYNSKGDVINRDTVSNIEAVIGSRQNDNLTGAGNAERLDGNAGNDTLIGNAGNDTLIGGDGSDWLRGGVGDDSLSGGTGNNRLDGDAGNDILISGGGNDSLNGGDGNDLFVMNNLQSNNVLNGGAGVDRIDYSGISDAGFSVRVDLSKGISQKLLNSLTVRNDTLVNIEAVTGSGNGDWLNGSALADGFDGGGGNDQLLGNAGNDTLNGGSGNDSMAGGDGNDLIVQDNFSGSDTVDGGAGVDTLDYSLIQKIDSIAFGGVTVDLAAGSAVKNQNGQVVGTDVLSNIEAVSGSAYDDRIVGTAKAETLEGLDGNDTLNGGGGNDVLSGGAGNDLIVQDHFNGSATIYGGTGVLPEGPVATNYDTVDYSQASLAGARIVADFMGGTVKKYQGDVLLGTDVLINVDHVIGSAGDDVMIASRDAWDLNGGAGNDLLQGFGENALLAGGDGDDEIVLGVGTAITNVDGGAGFDGMSCERETSAVIVNLAAGTVSLMQAGGLVQIGSVSNIEWVYDSSYDDTLIGSANGDYLDCGSGNDILNGDGGRDALSGGSGNDTLNGDAGDDQIDAGVGNDVINGGAGFDTIVQSAFAGNDTIDGGDGDDVVDYSTIMDGRSSIAVDLGNGTVTKYLDGVAVGTDTLRNIENIVATSKSDTMTGGSTGDVLSSNEGNDVLNGLAGNDTLIGGYGADDINGGNGDDQVVQDDFLGSDTIDGGLGSDTVDYSAPQDQLSRIELDLATGFAFKYLRGEPINLDIMHEIDNVIATASSDIVKGDGGNNALVGNGGDDSLDGRAGDDELMGDAGNDSLNGGDGSDLLSGGVGNDLSAGGAGDDMIWQFELTGNDTIDGGSGSDTVLYHNLALGDSFIVVDLAAGTVHKFQHGLETGIDTLSNIEGITGTGGNDTINGSSNADKLDGAEGSDVIAGGAGDDYVLQSDHTGNDTLDGGSGNDVLDYSGATASLDHVTVDLKSGIVQKWHDGAISGTDTIQLFESIVGSAHDDVMTGNDQANVFIGSAGNDTINGVYGNDLVDGGSGNDLLYFGWDNDDIRGGDGDDHFVFDGATESATLDGGSGRDTLDYSLSSLEDGRIVVDLAAGTVTKFLGDLNLGTDVFSNIESVIGTGHGDAIVGSALDDLINGLGNDTLSGGDGNDHFMQLSASSNARIDGGAGFDTVDYSQLDNSGVSIIVDLAAGTVQKYQAGQLVGQDTLTGVEQVIGTRNSDSMMGTQLDEVLIGGGGDDTLHSGGGNDTLDGGSGNDALYYGGTLAVISGGAGDDHIVLLQAYDGAHVGGVQSTDVLDATNRATVDGGQGNDVMDYTSAGLTEIYTYSHSFDPEVLHVGKVIETDIRYIVGDDDLTNIENVVAPVHSGDPVITLDPVSDPILINDQLVPADLMIIGNPVVRQLDSSIFII